MIKLDPSKIYYLTHPCTSGGKTLIQNKLSESEIASNLMISNPKCSLIRPLIIIPEDMKDQDAMSRCYKMLSACDDLLLSPHWNNSTGCLMEYEFAIKNGISVIELQGGLYD